MIRPVFAQPEHFGIVSEAPKGGAESNLGMISDVLNEVFSLQEARREFDISHWISIKQEE